MKSFRVHAGSHHAALPAGVSFSGPSPSSYDPSYDPSYDSGAGGAQTEHQPARVGTSSVPLMASAQCDPRQPLPRAAVQWFRDDGYLVVPDLCSAHERLVIHKALTGLFAQQAGRQEGNQLDMLGSDCDDQVPLQPQLLKPSLYAPLLLRTDYYRRVRAIARQLLGDDATFNFDHSIIKPAGRIAATPWHQDEAHRHDPDSYCEQISFWMPLQDVDEENGCMRYVPGSNRGKLLPHRSPGNDPRVHALECLPEYVDESAARALPVPAGWCILHAGRTLHSALPNHSASDRLVYIISFRGRPVPRREKTAFAWLEEKRTPAMLRNQGWRRRGGSLVLFARRLGLFLNSDVRTLPERGAGFIRRVRARLT